MIFHPRKWLEPHLLDALDAVRFELWAWKGRLFSPKRINIRGKEYLQLGCHDTQPEQFLNTDFFLNRRADAGLDARFSLPFENDTWRGIYAHHVVEHLSYEDDFKLFRECRRTLKPGGVFRMIVPDIETFIRFYSSSEPAERIKIFDLYPKHAMMSLNARTPLEVLDHIFRDSKFNRHLSAWDWETAELRLREAGFLKVVRQSVNVSLDTRLAGYDKPHWSQFSLYVEALK